MITQTFSNIHCRFSLNLLLLTLFIFQHKLPPPDLRRLSHNKKILHKLKSQSIFPLQIDIIEHPQLRFRSTGSISMQNIKGNLSTTLHFRNLKKLANQTYSRGVSYNNFSRRINKTTQGRINSCNIV